MVYKYLFESLLSVLLSIYLEMELQDLVSVLVSLFEEPTNCFPQWVHHFTCPPIRHRVPVYPYHCQCLFSFVLITANLIVVKWYLILVFIFISLMISDIEHLFTWLLALYLYFGEMFIRGFFVCLFVFNILVAKILALCALVLTRNSETVLEERERVALSLWQAKREHSRLALVPPSLGNRERSYSQGSCLAVGDKDQGSDGLAFFWWVGGEGSRSQQHQPSGSSWSGVCMLGGSVPSLSINFSHLEGVSVSAEQLKDTFVCIHWLGHQDYCFSWLFVSPLSPIPSLP